MEPGRNAMLEVYAQRMGPGQAMTASALADAWERRGACLVRLGRLDQARADLDRALALSPSDPQAWYNRAGVHEDMGDLAAAQADMERFLTLVPDSDRGKARLRAIKALRAAKD